MKIFILLLQRLFHDYVAIAMILFLKYLSVKHLHPSLLQINGYFTLIFTTNFDCKANLNVGVGGMA